MAGLVPAIHVAVRIEAQELGRRLQSRSLEFLAPASHVTTWIPGTSPGMTPNGVEPSPLV
jgi:hypothetical protein